MEKLKKTEAFARATAAFGEWRSWGRAQHLAYGLIRGVPYEAMEKCANDNPHSVRIVWALYQLGAWPEVKVDRSYLMPEACRKEVEALVVWVRKTPRGPRIRPSRGLPAAVGT
jgi:hypothetical protein